jgi:hypothetical protein
MDLLSRLNQAYTSSDSDESCSDSPIREMIKPQQPKGSTLAPLPVNPAPLVDVSDLVAE